MFGKGSGLTIQNQNYLERVQKVALKIILKEKYKSYENALNFLELDTLKQRRIHMSLSFARNCLKTKNMKHIFPPNIGHNVMNTRYHEHFHVLHTNTKRMQDSLIIYLKNQLNNEIKIKQEFDKVWNSAQFLIVTSEPLCVP